MILVSAVAPILTLVLVLLYIMLALRFFKIKSKLPVLGLRGGLSGLNGKRKRLAMLCLLFFLACYGGRLAVKAWSPDMLMVFHYEEAARGQNPNATRFNESNILSDQILGKVIERGCLSMSVDQLSDFLTIATPLDGEKLDISTESSLKISTEYWIHCSEKVSLYHTTPKRVLNFLADVYWEEFTRNYAENDDVLDLSFDGLEGMEYLDVKNYLEMQANKLRNYLPGYSSESSSFRADGSEETFASLTKKIDNFIDIELERYEAFVLENGLSASRNTYQSRMQYANRLLDTDRKKDMAAHDVRIEAIDMYNSFMTRFVLIPTYDTEQEFYMSRTKVGVDYFADEAKELLESATKLVEEIEHNSYVNVQVGKSRASSDVYAQADQRIEELNAELMNLAAQSRELCDAYVREKRDGYIQVSFAAPSLVGGAMRALFMTALFAFAKGALYILEPFYREYRKSRSDERKNRKRMGRKKKVQREVSA